MTPTQAFLNSTDELICTVNSSGKILDSNLSWKTYFATHEVTSIFDLFNLDFSHELTKLLANENFSNINLPDTKLIHPKGEVRWTTIKVQLLANRNFLFILNDTTKDKRNSDLLTHVLESFDIGHFSFDSETQKLLWSSKVFELFEKEEDYFEPDMKYMIHAFGDKHIEYLNNLFNSPLSRKIDVIVPFTRQDGNISWFNIKARKTFSTPISYSFIGIIQDVTREKLKEILQLSQNVERSCYEKAMDKFSMIVHTDKFGKITYANDKFCEFSGYDQDEIIGQSFQVESENEAWRGEIKNKAKDGSEYWVDTIVIPIRDSEGKLIEIVSYLSDLTPLKHYKKISSILKNKIELIVPNQDNLLWDFCFIERKLTVEYKFLEMLDIDHPEEMNLDTFFTHFQNVDSEKLNKFIANKNQNSLELSCTLKLKSCSFKSVLKLRIIRNERGEAIHLDGLCELTEKIMEVRATEVIEQ